MCASVLRFSVALPVYTVHFILKLLCFVLLFVCFTTRGCAQSRDVRALCKCEKNLITSIALSASGGRAASASSAEHRTSPKPKKKSHIPPATHSLTRCDYDACSILWQLRAYRCGHKHDYIIYCFILNIMQNYTSKLCVFCACLVYYVYICTLYKHV